MAGLPLLIFALSSTPTEHAQRNYETSAIAGLGGPALQQIMSNLARDDQQGELQGVLSSVAAIAMGVSPLIMTAIFAFFTRENTLIYAPGMPFLAAAAMMLVALAIFVRARRSRHRPAGRTTS